MMVMLNPSLYRAYNLLGDTENPTSTSTVGARTTAVDAGFSVLTDLLNKRWELFCRKHPQRLPEKSLEKEKRRVVPSCFPKPVTKGRAAIQPVSASWTCPRDGASLSLRTGDISDVGGSGGGRVSACPAGLHTAVVCWRIPSAAPPRDGLRCHVGKSRPRG